MDGRIFFCFPFFCYSIRFPITRTSLTFNLRYGPVHTAHLTITNVDRFLALLAQMDILMRFQIPGFVEEHPASLAPGNKETICDSTQEPRPDPVLTRSFSRPYV